MKFVLIPSWPQFESKSETKNQGKLLKIKTCLEQIRKQVEIQGRLLVSPPVLDTPGVADNVFPGLGVACEWNRILRKKQVDCRLNSRGVEMTRIIQKNQSFLRLAIWTSKQ
jgi:hypothetical protein